MVVALAVLALVVTGCGGGGGGNDSGGGGGNSIHGFANIHSDSVRPHIACLDLVNGSWRTLTCASISRASGGWQDKAFRVRVPAAYAGMVITVVVFNDLNDNDRYDSGELLGFMDHFLEWEDGNYVIAEGGYVYHWNALTADLYIDCVYTKSMSMEDKDAAMKRAIQSEIDKKK